MEEQFELPQAPSKSNQSTAKENSQVFSVSNDVKPSSYPETAEEHRRKIGVKEDLSSLPSQSKADNGVYFDKSGKALGHIEKSSVSHLVVVTKDGVKAQIPQSLTILPSDTESQKAAKKKKLHSLKCLARNREEEEKGKQIQENWLKFKHSLESKKGKKRTHTKS